MGKTEVAKKVVIIVAGGSGRRMGAKIPKQFLQISGKPILMHTIQRFHDYDSSLDFKLVLPQSEIDYWKNLYKQYNFKVQHKIVEGGETRFHSVKNALFGLKPGQMVAVHDGVRPLVSAQTIKNCFEGGMEKGTAIPVTPCKDSIREIQSEHSRALKRMNLVHVQTPQVFRSEILIDAYQVEYHPIFTDDASIVENQGHNVNLVEGNEENIKITSQIDLQIAEMLINNVKV